MKSPPSGLWRKLRYLILLATAGVLLAANNSWLTSLRLDFTEPVDWLSNFDANENLTAEQPAAVADAASPVAATSTVSMDRFVNSFLFSPSAGGWQLEAPRTNFTTAFLAQQPNTPDFQSRATSLPAATFSSGSIAPLGAGLAPDGGPPVGPGFWISNASGNWSTATNWQGGVVPSGASAVAHFDTLDITTAVTVTLDSSRLIGEVYVGDTNGTHSYNIAPGSSGQRLVFDSGTGVSVLHQSSTSAGDTISVPLALNSDLTISNASTTQPFQISGAITSNRATPTVSQITFLGTVFVSGAITKGSSGGDISLNIQNADVNLSGTNTYTGGTFVTGKLFVKGDNSGATGAVQVAGSGSLLSGIGTVGGNVSVFGGTITGGTTTEVGRLTLTQNLAITASEGGGGTYLANLSGDLSDLLAIGGTLQIGNGTTLDIHGAADGTTTYILATFAGGGLTGMFDFVNGLPANYTLVYTSSDIELIPTAVPEPATWIGGALALGAISAVRLRRKRWNTEWGMRNWESKARLRGANARHDDCD